MSVTACYGKTYIFSDDPFNATIDGRSNSNTVVFEDMENILDSVAGSLHKYANPSLIDQEGDAWRKAAKHDSQHPKCRCAFEGVGNF